MEITLEKLQELIIEPEQMKEIAGIQEEMLDYSATIELMAKVDTLNEATKAFIADFIGGGGYTS